MKAKNKAILFIVAIFMFITFLSAWYAAQDDKKCESSSVTKQIRTK